MAVKSPGPYWLKRFDEIQWLIMAGDQNDKKTWRMVARLTISNPDEAAEAHSIVNRCNTHDDFVNKLEHLYYKAIEAHRHFTCIDHGDGECSTRKYLEDAIEQARVVLRSIWSKSPGRIT